MILSNQAKCRKCGDEPYSANRHDFKYCGCGSMAVDGGMDYIRRVGDVANTYEMSIDLEDEVAKACLKNIKEMVDSGRNELGILCGIARTLRDNGYSIQGEL